MDIYDACEQGDVEVLKSHISSGKNMNTYKLVLYHPDKSSLSTITSSNSTKKGIHVELEDDDMMDEYGDSSQEYFDYRSPLYFAIVNNQLQCVRLLVENKVDLYRLRPWGLNALCLAVYCRHLRIIQYLLMNNLVDRNISDKPNATDSYFNSLKPTHEHKQTFLGCHRNVAQDIGQFHYPLHIAVTQNSIEIIKLLIECGDKCDINISEPYTKRSALHIAATTCSRDCIHVLLANGCNPNCRDVNSRTVLDLAWNKLNNIEYEYDYREDILKDLLSAKAQFSSIKSLTDFYANSLPAFRRFEGNLWIVFSYNLQLIFIDHKQGEIEAKQILLAIWRWFNDNYQDTVMQEDEFDRHYTGSILRNIIHVMYVNGQISLNSKELIELFQEDLGSHFDEATDEIDIIQSILSTPLKLKQMCRNYIRKQLCYNGLNWINIQRLPKLNDELKQYIQP